MISMRNLVFKRMEPVAQGGEKSGGWSDWLGVRLCSDLWTGGLKAGNDM